MKDSRQHNDNLFKHTAPILVIAKTEDFLKVNIPKDITKKIDKNYIALNYEIDMAPILKSPHYIAWAYVIMLLISYLIGEIIISIHPISEIISQTHSYGGIASYNVSLTRKYDLSIHFMTQTLFIPAYITLNFLALSKAKQRIRNLSKWNAVFGGMTTTLIIWLLYTPAKDGISISSRRTDIIEGLVSHFNFPYALFTSILIFSATICTQSSLIIISNIKIKKH